MSTQAPHPTSRAVDAASVTLEAQGEGQRRTLGRFVGLVSSAMRFVWAIRRGLLVLLCALQLFSAGLLAAQVIVTKGAAQRVLEASSTLHGAQRAVPWLIAYAAIAALSQVSGVVLTQVQRLLNESVVQATQDRVLDVTSRVDLSSFENDQFFDQVQRVQANALTRPVLLVQGVIATIGSIAAVGALASALLAIEPLLLPVLLVAALPLYIVSKRTSRAEFEFTRDQTAANRERGYLRFLLSEREAAAEIRSFQLAKILRDRHDISYNSYMTGLRRHVKRRLRLSLLATLVSTAVVGATLVLIVVLVADGRLKLSNAAAAGIAVQLLSSRIQGLFNGLGGIFESALFLKDLNDFFALASKTTTEGDRGEPAPPFKTLALNQVSFGYPGASLVAIKDVSLRLRAGEVIALVGENGSGKTTVAKLLAQLYSPDTGTVTWNGTDAATLQRSSLRAQMAVLFQDFVRYKLTARDNVVLGRWQHSSEDGRFDAALEQAGATKLVEQLPLGSQTTLSKQFAHGQELSLGQWQRIALARAYFRDAPVVVLDEPTASLDPVAEHDLFTRLRELLTGRAVVLISHRFSSVTAADRIYVMHEGAVVEVGTHKELMAQGGRYERLFSLQARAYFPEDAELL